MVTIDCLYGSGTLPVETEESRLKDALVSRLHGYVSPNSQRTLAKRVLKNPICTPLQTANQTVLKFLIFQFHVPIESAIG